MFRKLTFAGLLVCMAALTACAGQRYIVYDEYMNEAGRAKVAGSKNVWITSVDYNNDLIVVEFKQKGYTIDASKADYAIELSSQTFARGVTGMVTLTFTIKDAKTNAVLFSKIGMYVMPPNNEEVRDFIRDNVALFQGTKA